jgi:tetratricopeptide (TPR) repeat protein
MTISHELESARAAEDFEEHDEDYDGEYEDDDEEYEEEQDEDYERWVTPDRRGRHLKPLVIGLVAFALLAVGAVSLAVAFTDPADKFDSAPIINVPGETSALSATAAEEGPVRVEMPDSDPVAAANEAAVVLSSAEPAPEAEPELAPAEPAVETEPPVEDVVAEPVVAAVEEPAEEHPAPILGDGNDRYDELMEQVRKARGRKAKEELLRQAIEVNPKGDDALATLAMMLMERGKTRDEALGLAKRAVEVNPDNGLAWLVIGYVKQVVGKAAEAKDAYRKCAGCSGPKKYVRECRLLG